MPLANILDVPEPVVDQPQLRPFERRAHAAAAVVAGDDHVSHAKHIDCVLQHREAIEVGVDDHVGDVAMDEELTGREIDNLVCRHAAVGTTNPQILRRLLLLRAGRRSSGRARPSAPPSGRCYRTIASVQTSRKRTAWSQAAEVTTKIPPRKNGGIELHGDVTECQSGCQRGCQGAHAHCAPPG